MSRRINSVRRLSERPSGWFGPPPWVSSHDESRHFHSEFDAIDFDMTQNRLTAPVRMSYAQQDEEKRFASAKAAFDAEQAAHRAEEAEYDRQLNIGRALASITRLERLIAGTRRRMAIPRDGANLADYRRTMALFQAELDADLLALEREKDKLSSLQSPKRNPREVSVSRTLRTAPGGAWYGVIYHGGGAGGYRSPDEVAKAILGPFEKRADIPTRLGQFSDGGFIRAVKLTAPMPNWMRKLPNLDTLVATVKGTKRRNPALSQQQQRKLMQALERDARTLADMANQPRDAMFFALFDENGNRMIDWTLDMVGGSQEDPELGMRPHPRWIIAPHAVGDDFDSMGYRFRVTAPNRAIRFARIVPKYDWDRTGEQVLIPLGPPMKKNGRGRGR